MRLGDVAEEVTVGHVGSMAAEYITDGVPFLRSQNVLPHVLDLSDVKMISESFHQRLAKSRLRPGDVVTVRTGKPGTTAVIPDSVPEMNCADLVITRPGSNVNSRWLSYYINSAARGFIAAQLVGAVQQHFNVGSAKAMELLLPPLEEQVAVVEVLGALDDKIVANTRTSTVALELASSHFSAAVSGIDFSLSTYGDVCEIGGGGTPRTGVSDYWNGDIPWATPTDVTALAGPYLETTSRSISELGLANCSSALYPASSILMTSRATIGAFAIAGQPMAVNQGFIVVRPHDEQLKWWILHDMQSRVDEFVSHANGATFMELSRGKFKALPARLASKEAMYRFNADAAALHGSARGALRENTQLAMLRDTLLPYLISGRLRVKDAEKQVEAVA